MYKFDIREDFYLNDKKIKIISGALHYFRVVPEYWTDRLEKLKALGCNTVETYVPWNFHEPKEGVFDFEGQKDLAKFTKLAQDLGLLVILRPTPYICAEWEFGGLPAWLLKYPSIRVRSNCEIFLNSVDKYFAELFKHIYPLQATQGGPIIMMQIENEYGSFGNNKIYLKNLKNMMIKYGCEVPLFTSDGAWREVLESGTILDEDVLPTVNFGSKTKEQFGYFKEFLEKNNLEKPMMCMEFWLGWFSNWGQEFKRRDAQDAANELKDMLDMGHVNFYMYHGGTNFGFYNGCCCPDEISPQTTNYDYDALLNEHGEFTEKYYKFKEVISNYAEIPNVDFSTNIKKISYGSVELKNKVSLFSTLDTISKPIYSENTLNMEALDQNYGYILYRSNIGSKNNLERFKLVGMDDRAQVFINENYHSTLYKEKFVSKNQTLQLEKEDNNILDILVENVGRVNYGPNLLSPSQRKGIKGGVMIDIHLHTGWDHYCLELNNIDKVDFSGDYKENTPAFYEYEFEVNELGDTFLNADDFGKGVAFINGFNLGRFWDIGPTNYLYIPAPLLKEGINKIVIFETEGKYKDVIFLDNKPNYIEIHK
ncbi:glycoside hydrolase family 35 protein [Paraclostridium bifermentans]|uniref:glycoside hydrolase family 35 protein n=1 Tax=Paraclostridium bifermentans TaxID=1490 RepID=UPI00359C6A7F